MSRRLDLSGMFLIVVSVALIVVTTFWGFQESLQEAYEQGCVDIIEAYYYLERVSKK